MTIQELEQEYRQAKNVMWDTKKAFYTASDGFMYNIYMVLAKNILDPTLMDPVVGKIQNAAAANNWWWHGRSYGHSYVMFTDNKNFNFDTAESINPIIEEEPGEYYPITAVVYRETETIKKIHDTLGEMLNPDSSLTHEDYCLSKLLDL